MPLTDTAVRLARAGEKTKKLSDARGLYLEVAPSGGKWWRLKYRFAQKEKRISLGTYPATSLKDARDHAETARRQLANGIDPSGARKAAKAVFVRTVQMADRIAAGLPDPQSFEFIALEWFKNKKDEWAESTASRTLARLKADVFPFVGKDDISQISPPRLLAVIRKIEERGALETARRALENCGQIFRYAIATGRVDTNPSRDLRDALRKAVVTHFPAITDPYRLGELLRAIEGYEGTPVVRAALKLMPLLLLRPGEFRFGKWEEVDLDKAIWTVPAVRMKRKKDGKLNGKAHLVQLPTQAISVFRALATTNGSTGYIFRGERKHDRPMSDATVNAALRAMGFAAEEVTGHGFRATARTMAVETLGFDEAVIEAQLAHTVRDNLGTAYNRTQFIEARKILLQRWADYLDQLRALKRPAR